MLTLHCIYPAHLSPPPVDFCYPGSAKSEDIVKEIRCVEAWAAAQFIIHSDGHNNTSTSRPSHVTTFPSVVLLPLAVLAVECCGLPDSVEFDSTVGDVFLTEKFRERRCRCDDCLPSLEAHPYRLEEDEIDEPPENPDSDVIGLPLEEPGMRARRGIAQLTGS
ncbi:hypothetical protein C8R47DRAFT_120186 [Mycena vitilis]|nr:hypothetical protein C8R47DRAFT_120186 [Mycena vitilis]